MQGKQLNKPNGNFLSIVLQIEYGESSILLGSDAEKRNWVDAIRNSRKWGLPKNDLVKVPHHGANNSFSPVKNKNYLKSLCKAGDSYSVLFAGDTKHPDQKVFEALLGQSNLLCLRNGLKDKDKKNYNPLKIEMKGARAYGEGSLCNPVLSFEVFNDGSINLREGRQCEHCQLDQL